MPQSQPGTPCPARPPTAALTPDPWLRRVAGDQKGCSLQPPPRHGAGSARGRGAAPCPPGGWQRRRSQPPGEAEQERAPALPSGLPTTDAEPLRLFSPVPLSAKLPSKARAGTGVPSSAARYCLALQTPPTRCTVGRPATRRYEHTIFSSPWSLPTCPQCWRVLGRHRAMVPPRYGPRPGDGCWERQEQSKRIGRALLFCSLWRESRKSSSSILRPQRAAPLLLCGDRVLG